MDIKEFAKTMQNIEMPDEMQARILDNCYKKINKETEYKIMTKQANRFIKKPLATAAAVALCLCIGGVTAIAATGKGFFKDVTRWDGAITGTAYEQATEEISIAVTEVTDTITVVATVVDPTIVPYMTFDEMRIGNYKILDAVGAVVIEGAFNEMVPYENGQITVSIPIESLESGTYKLIVDSFVGGSKADQPLVMSGNWECEFTK